MTTTTKDYPPKSKKELLEELEKLQKESAERKEKIAQMEAAKAKALSPKEDDEKLDTKQAEKALSQIKVKKSFTQVTELINKGYKESAANKISGIYGIIESQKEREKILVSNPEIKNSEKRLKTIRASIEESQKELNNLLNDIENQDDPEKVAKSKVAEFIDEKTTEALADEAGKPETDEEKARRLSEEAKAVLEEEENAKKNLEGLKYNFVWKNKRGDSDLIYMYEEGTFNFEISGKETEVIVYEKKTEWKESKIKRMFTLGFKKFGKEVFQQKPSWSTYVYTENDKLDKKYPKEYEFNTKEEAIKKAEEIINEGLRIKFEEEKKFMGISEPDSTAEPVAISSDADTKPENKGSEPISPEPTPPITPEKMKSYEEIIKKADEERNALLEKGPQSLRIKNGVLKGVKAWEKFGVEQRNKEGEIIKEGVFWKRAIKMTTNLALIGLISMSSVEYLAKQTSAISATALGGSMTTALGKKMFIGLGFGTLIDLNGKKIPSKLKKWMPIIMGIGGLGIATGLAGAFVPAAALASGASIGLGYLSSKFIKGSYTDEKLAQKKQEKTEKLFKKYAETNGEANEKNLENFEKDYIKLLKHFENLTIRGKLFDEGAKILTGSVVAGVVLGISGATQDHRLENEHIKETKAESAHEEMAKHLDDLKKQHEEAVAQIEKLDKQHEQSVADLKDQQAEIKNSENNTDDSNSNENNQPAEKNQTPVSQDKSEVKIENILVRKGEGIEHSFIRQIEGNAELAKELGYKGEIDDTKALHEFAGHQAHVVAIKTGYVDNQGNEVRIAEADKVGYEIKMEDGHVSVIEKTSTGEIVETHNEGDKFEDKIEKVEYVKNISQNNDTEATINSSANNTTIDTPKVEGQNGEYSTGEQINSETGLPVENIKSEQINPETGKPYAETGDGEKTTSTESSPGSVEIYKELTSVEIEHVDRVFDNNIDHLFRERPEGEWNSIQKLIPADRILELYDKGQVESHFKPLVHHIIKLEEVTGLHPYSYDPIDHPLGPEKIAVFMTRALEEATRIGKIDEVTL